MDNFDIFLNHERCFVRITGCGDISQAAGEEIVTIARTTAAEHGYHVLYDMTKANMKVYFSSWFELPRKLEVFKNPKTRQVKAAVLIDKDDKSIDDYKFYEVVSDNVGLKIRIFFDEETAVEWLGNEAPEQL